MYDKENKLILDCIYCEEQGKEITPESDKEKLEYLYKTFMSEYSYNIKRYGFQGAIREWLMGLPTACTLPFTYHDIIKLAKDYGRIPENATEKQENRICESYWDFMSTRIISLFNKHGIDWQAGIHECVNS